MYNIFPPVLSKRSFDFHCSKNIELYGFLLKIHRLPLLVFATFTIEKLAQIKVHDVHYQRQFFHFPINYVPSQTAELIVLEFVICYEKEKICNYFLSNYVYHTQHILQFCIYRS